VGKEPRLRRIEEDSTARDAHQTPHLSVDFTVTNVGYQMDLYIDGKCMKIECRDFGGAPKPSKSVERLLWYLDKAVEDWRQTL
jgi:hypothetical protein